MPSLEHFHEIFSPVHFCFYQKIFGKDNFINVITVKTKIGGVSGSSEGKSFKDATEFISVYAKYKGGISFNNVGQLTLLLDYIQAYIEEGKSWKYTSVITSLSGRKFIKEVNGYKFYSYLPYQTASRLQMFMKNLTPRFLEQPMPNQV